VRYTSYVVINADPKLQQGLLTLTLVLGVGTIGSIAVFGVSLVRRLLLSVSRDR